MGSGWIYVGFASQPAAPSYGISYIVYRIPHIAYRISYIVYRTSHVEYCISQIGYHILYIVYRISDISHIVYRISYITSRISYILYCVILYCIMDWDWGWRLRIASGLPRSSWRAPQGTGSSFLLSKSDVFR